MFQAIEVKMRKIAAMFGPTQLLGSRRRTRR